MKIFSLKTLLFLFITFTATVDNAHSQVDADYEKQSWIMGFFNWRLNDKWVFNQDFAYQHSLESPTFTRFLTRAQINRQITGMFSLHGGLNLFLKMYEVDDNAIEIRPWLGAKLRWPYFWRFNFSQYLRFEQRFEHTVVANDWENNFRVRYKISSNIPINHSALKDKTLYGLIAYEFLSYSFGDDIRFTSASAHRFDLGLGYRQNTKNRYEAVLLAFNSRDEPTEQYSFSDIVLFLKYKRYINWE